MTKTTNYTFTSADDRHTRIHGIKWENENNDCAAVLQIVHGMQEHIERYSEFAQYLTEKGFKVYGHDHIGHGESVEKEDDRGKMYCARPDDVMVEDMFSNYKIIKEENPGKPYFILGHSMGSYLLRKYLSVKAPELKDVNGAIIMGTGCVNDAALVFGNVLCAIVTAVKGRDGYSKFIHSLMFGGDYKRFDMTGEHPENSWLSKNVENVKVFLSPNNRKDRYEFSLNGYRILLRSTWFDNRMSNIRKMNLDIPVIFVSGDHDPVGGMGAGVRKSYEKFARAGVKDLSIRLYEGDRHEILNETDRAMVYEELYEWMNKRTGR